MPASSARNREAEMVAKNERAEVATGSKKAESGNHDNAFEAGAKSERANREFEGKLPPFFSFFFWLFSYVVLLQQRR
jgi:hypothetical protein